MSSSSSWLRDLISPLSSVLAANKLCRSVGMSCCLRKAWSSGWVMLSKLWPYKSDWWRRKKVVKSARYKRDPLADFLSGRKTIRNCLRSNTCPLPEFREWTFHILRNWFQRKQRIVSCEDLRFFSRTRLPCNGPDTARRCSRWERCCRDT